MAALELMLQKKRSLLQNFVNFKRSPGKKMSSKFFSQALWRSSRRNKIDHDLGPFSTSQKLVLQRRKPVGSRFFDRPVKPVEKPVKVCFLATKRHVSTNRNILIYFIINKTFYKKNSINKPHTFENTC